MSLLPSLTKTKLYFSFIIAIIYLPFYKCYKDSSEEKGHNTSENWAFLANFAIKENTKIIRTMSTGITKEGSK